MIERDVGDTSGGRLTTMDGLMARFPKRDGAFHLRGAVLSDVEEIEDIVREVWGQEILADVCRAQIEDDACELWIAEDGDDVVGFCSAFLTVDRGGNRRWEMDLIAVRPGQQGEGVGQRLIRQACRGAARQEAAVARALIRLSNIPSQRAFQRAGFATDRQGYLLLLWSSRPVEGSTTRPNDVSLLPVDTLTYRGLWIEGLEKLAVGRQRLVVDAARSIAAREKRSNTGALIPNDKEHLVAADLRSQAKLHGAYYWYVRHGSAEHKT